MFWKCRHPANSLAVYSVNEHPVDDDFYELCVKLQCRCGAIVEKKCSILIGGVNGFLSQAPVAEIRNG